MVVLEASSFTEILIKQKRFRKIVSKITDIIYYESGAYKVQTHLSEIQPEIMRYPDVEQLFTDHLEVIFRLM